MTDKSSTYEDIVDSLRELQLSESVEMPPEFSEVNKILDKGAKKHGANSFLQEDVFKFGPRLQSMFRHLTKVSGIRDQRSNTFGLFQALALIEQELGNCRLVEKNIADGESGESHFLHSACNALMFHTVIERGIMKKSAV